MAICGLQLIPVMAGAGTDSAGSTLAPIEDQAAPAVLKALKASKEAKEVKALLDLKEIKALAALLAVKEFKDLKAIRGLRALRVPPDLPAALVLILP
jgi:hypothetical protein